MLKWDLLVPTYSEGAMNVGVADVNAHVGHARTHGCVFWDVNEEIDDDIKEQLVGSRMYLSEKGGVVYWGFTIVKVLPGHKMYEKWVKHPKLKDYFTESRKYDKDDLKSVLGGDKCATLILLKRPEDMGAMDVSEFTDWRGNQVKKPVRGSHRFVEPLDR